VCQPHCAHKTSGRRAGTEAHCQCHCPVLQCQGVHMCKLCADVLPVSRLQYTCCLECNNPERIPLQSNPGYFCRDSAFIKLENSTEHCLWKRECLSRGSNSLHHIVNIQRPRPQRKDTNIGRDLRTKCTVKGGYTLVTLPCIVTPYRDSVDGTRDRITYQKLVRDTVTGFFGVLSVFGRNRTIPLMRRPNTDSTKARNVTA